MDSIPPQELQAPAGPPPPGVVPNLDDPRNMRTAGRAAMTLCFVLATLALLLRVYTKLFVVRQFKLSDYCIVLGWGVFTGYFVPSWRVSVVDPCVDQWNLRAQDLISMLYYSRIGSILYGVCIFFVKVSILLQYLELFTPLKNTMYWVCHLLIGINFVFYLLWYLLLFVFACKPIDKVWNPLLQGSCMNTLAINVAGSSINSASDVIILVLPQLTIWRLQMALQRRIAVSAMFLIGIFACVSSIIRLAYTVLLYQNQNNLSYYYCMAGIWTLPEMASGILVACLPVAPRFFCAMKQNRHLLRLSSSVRSLLEKSSLRSRRTTETYEMDRNTTPGRQRPSTKGYEKYADDYPLTASSSKTSAASRSAA